MTTFKDIAAGDDLAVFFNTAEFAETVSYNGESIAAVVEYALKRDPDSVMDSAYLLVQADDVPAPAYPATAVIDGVTWYVQQGPYSRDDGNVWRLPIQSDERPVI